MTDSTADGRHLLRRFLEEAPDDEDLGVLDEVTTEDVVFEAVTGKQFEGRETVRRVLAEAMGAYEEFEHEIEWTVAQADRVVASTATRGEPTEGILGVPPPEGERVIDTLFDARLEDGRIAYLRQVLDTRQMMPAAMRHGRGAVLQGLDEAVLVLDDRDLAVDANPAMLSLLDSDREAVLGEHVDDLLSAVPDSGTADDPVEVEHDGSIFELRSSGVTDPDGAIVGRTLVARDVTARTRRVDQLSAQRDELERLSDLNGVIRGVNQALVSASSRSEIDRLVCERLVNSDLYRSARVADMVTWLGEAERWTAAGSEPDAAPAPPLLEDGFRTDDESSIRRSIEPATTDGGGVWTAVPLVYGRTVYGALGLFTERAAVGERERDVLVELGETIGHAINAVETRRLLSAGAVVELEVVSTDDADPLVVASRSSDCRLSVSGLVPVQSEATLAFVDVDGCSPDAALDALDPAVRGEVQVVGDGDDASLEWTVTGDSLLGTLVEYGVHVRDASAGDGRVRYILEVASESDVRSLVDHVTRRFPDASVTSKEERSGPVDTPGGTPSTGFGELTERQREALEVAYRSGYFNWPRDSTAEEVATSLDIAPATLHSHLRKAQAKLFADLFDGDVADP